jgi:hypothetical protein
MSAVDRARKRIESRLTDIKVKAFGLNDDLRVILDVINELDRRTSVLAAALLRRHFGADRLSSTQVDVLMAMSDGDSASAKNHKAGCECDECAHALIQYVKEVGM